jgi:CheY-like chemotaxis protein
MTKKRILCVEDSPRTCELISTVLKKFEVVSAYGKADALIKQGRFIPFEHDNDEFLFIDSSGKEVKFRRTQKK